MPDCQDLPADTDDRSARTAAWFLAPAPGLPGRAAGYRDQGRLRSSTSPSAARCAPCRCDAPSGGSSTSCRRQAPQFTPSGRGIYRWRNTRPDRTARPVSTRRGRRRQPAVCVGSYPHVFPAPVVRPEAQKSRPRQIIQRGRLFALSSTLNDALGPDKDYAAAGGPVACVAEP